VVHVALTALEHALEIIRVVLEPGELGVDRGFLHLVQGEAGAHAVEQIVVVLAVVMLPFARHGERGVAPTGLAGTSARHRGFRGAVAGGNHDGLALRRLCRRAGAGQQAPSSNTAAVNK
jgi:hypothetical protein